jgi:HPt (histidine-containing phosphotransfer) domain-containing protein
MTEHVPVLDLERFQELESLAEGDSEFLHDIFHEFHTTSTGSMHELKCAFHDGDLSRIRQIAHTMKGSSMNLGLYRMARTAASIESLDDSVPPGEVDRLMHMLNTSFDLTVAEIRRSGLLIQEASRKPSR